MPLTEAGIDAARMSEGGADVEAGDPDAGAPDAGGDDPTTGDAGSCAIRDTHDIVVSQPIVEVARMPPSPLFATRLLGPIARVRNGDHVWTFTNAVRVASVPAVAATPANHPFVAFDGEVEPWKGATGAWLLRTNVAVDVLPPTMLPLLPGEPTSTSLIPTSIFRHGSDPQNELYVQQYDYLNASKVWLATLADNEVQAVRSATPVFTEPPFFGLAARIEQSDSYVYSYACSSDSPSLCYAGRVPYAQRDDASAYQVRMQLSDETWTWTSDLQAGTAVLEDVNQSDLSISWNDHLGRFLVVHGEPFRNDVVMRTAKAAFGPWDPPVRVPLPAPKTLYNLAIREQPPITARNCEKRVYITYFAPSERNGIIATNGDVVMAAIDLD